MTIRVLRLAVLVAALAAPLSACVFSGAPYDQADQYKTSGGFERMGDPGSSARD